jgi:hypothetical protein
LTKYNKPIINDRFLYRRQYVIGPCYIESFENWVFDKVGDFLISAHPDLELSIIRKNNIELALLGFMFDYKKYKASNFDILNEIYQNYIETKNIYRATEQYSGRWLLVFTSKTESLVLNDPCGLRQIYYCNHNNDMWFASQPHLLASLINKQKRTNNAVLSYINSKAYKFNERLWVDDHSAFQDIFRLTPNHYLDLKSGQVQRFWPYQKRTNLDPDKIAEGSLNILTNFLKAAEFRSNTMQTITAGIDTRVLLAASNPIRKNKKYFVHRFQDMNDDHEDIYITKLITNKLNIDFKIIDCYDYDLEFDNILTKNIFQDQSDRKKYQHYNFFHSFQDQLIITGNVVPIIKKQYPSVTEPNAESFARLIRYHDQELAIIAIDKWLKESIDVATKYDIPVEMLFYWEIRFGSWAPMFNAALDLSTEEFVPYNCRELLSTMLNTDIKYRTKPDNILLTKIINIAWPELNSYPVNPQSYKNYYRRFNITKVMQQLLKKIGMYNLGKKIFRKYLLR